MAIVFSEKGEEVVYKTKKTEAGVKCDICGKFIEAVLNRNKNTYFYVTTGHLDWGNDSIDSIEKQDVCPDCIHDFVSNYLRDCNSTEYIEIETSHTYARSH